MVKKPEAGIWHGSLHAVSTGERFAGNIKARSPASRAAPNCLQARLTLKPVWCAVNKTFYPSKTWMPPGPLSVKGAFKVAVCVCCYKEPTPTIAGEPWHDLDTPANFWPAMSERGA